MTILDWSIVDHCQLAIAGAPWFGFCKGTCGRELGMTKEDRYIRPYGELAMKLPMTDGWFCVPCGTEAVRLEALRAYDEKYTREGVER